MLPVLLCALPILLVLGALAPAPVVRAHDVVALEEASPGPNAVLAALPPRLFLQFDDDLDGDASGVSVTGPLGERADRRDTQIDGAGLLVSLIDQGPGVYTVRWRAKADHGDRPTRGQYVFSVQPFLPPTAPQIIVTPQQAANGQPVTVAGSGFRPSGTVVLTVGDGETLLATVQTDARGRFTSQAVLPADLPYGRQVVQAADAASHLATCAIEVPAPGGIGVVAVRLVGEPTEGQIDYALRVENRSDFRLSNVVVRVPVPPGTFVLAEGLGQPDSAGEARVSGGEVVWRMSTLPPHTMRGPFTFSVTTTALRGRPTLTTTATVDYVFAEAPRPIGGQARSDDVSVQVATR